MIEISEAKLEMLSVHAVGNKSKEEGCTPSMGVYDLDAELEEVLFRYFLKPFKSEDLFKFKHEVDLNMNEMFSYAKTIFEDPDKFHLYSVNMLKHLYNQSEHPHIKSGEVYIAKFTDVVLEGELVEAIGVFKSENKDTFIKARDKGNFVMLGLEKGIDVKKLDKGCLIFNTEKESGYRVMTVDQNNYDTQYWKDDFLGLEEDKNDVYLTKNVINLCKDFSKEVVRAEGNPKDQAMFMAKSVDAISHQEQFSMDDFKEELFRDAPVEMKDRFEDYQQVYKESRQIDTIDGFEVAEDTLKKEKRKIKNIIELDTNIQIKMNFNDAHSGDKFLERGYDAEKDMYFYKVYFNREKR